MGMAMSLNSRDTDLLAQVAMEAGVPPQLLLDLANLEQHVPDVNILGSKAELTRRVTALLNDYAAREGAD